MAVLDSPRLIPSTATRTIELPDSWGERECLPDETLILRLLRANDGCLWQSEVAEAISKSPATVSRRLSNLDNGGHITRFPFRGRKIVWLTPDEPHQN